MKIERVLHVRSSKMDFYDLSYFLEAGLQILDSDKLYGYGKTLHPAKKTYSIFTVIDLKAFITAHPDTPLESPISGYEDFVIERAVIPPSLVKTSATELAKDTVHMDYWLSFYNGCTPDIKSAGSTDSIHTSIPADRPNDINFSFDKFTVQHKNTLPIVNGFACYPVLDGRRLLATDGATYLKDRDDRDRQLVVVDFSPVGEASFHKLSNLGGTLKEFVLPTEYDASTMTVLVVIDGRLLLPEDYDVLANHVVIKTGNLNAAMELDRLVCTGAAVETSSRTVTSDGTRDLYSANNSFVILVTAKNLQIVQHAPWYKTKMRTFAQGSNSYEAIDKNQYDQYARGLLYDKKTRSIYDYSREEHTSTFYAEETDKEVSWKSSTVTIKAERPLVILRGKRDNLMSAKAMLFDRPKEFAHDDMVLWPDFVILDLVFRG